MVLGVKTNGLQYGNFNWITTNTTGGGGAHNNMPPYVAVNIWKRTK